MDPDPRHEPVSHRTRRAWFGVAVAIMVTVIVGLSGSISWLLVGIQWPDLAALTSPRVIVLTATNGEILPHAGELRLASVAVGDMPANVLNAVLSIEDRRFYRHGALDFRSVLRAFIQNLEAGRIVAGGSTITQQLVKTNFLGPERTYRRKFREAVLSIWLEHNLTKGQILTGYLNTVYLGSGAKGFPAAAQIYFGKKVAGLDLAQAAMLAGMVNAPEQDDPLHNLDAARRRAATVLDAMVVNGKLSENEALMAKLHPATPGSSGVRPASNGWFGDWVYEKALLATPADAGTVQIRTSLDPEL